ncbi:MAG TPA: hypothetical protein VGD53_03895, partial [Actinoallomurus sp.]
MRSVGNAWGTAGAQLQNELGPAMIQVVNHIRTDFTGKSAIKFADMMAPYVADSPQYIPQAIEQFQALKKYLLQTSTQVEYVKLITIEELVLLLAQIAWAIAMSYWTAGQSMAWLAARMAIVRFLLRTWWGRLILQFALAEGFGVAFQTALDGLTQAVQFAKGTRSSWDVKATVTAVEVGAVGGALAIPLSVIAHPLADALTTSLSKTLGKDVTITSIEPVVVRAVNDAARIMNGTGTVNATAKDVTENLFKTAARMDKAVQVRLAEVGVPSVVQMVEEGLHEALTEGVVMAANGQGFTFNPYSFTAGMASSIARQTGEGIGAALAPPTSAGQGRTGGNDDASAGESLASASSSTSDLGGRDTGSLSGDTLAGSVSSDGASDGGWSSDGTTAVNTPVPTRPSTPAPSVTSETGGTQESTDATTPSPTASAATTSSPRAGSAQTAPPTAADRPGTTSPEEATSAGAPVGAVSTGATSPEQVVSASTPGSVPSASPAAERATGGTAEAAPASASGQTQGTGGPNAPNAGAGTPNGSVATTGSPNAPAAGAGTPSGQTQGAGGPNAQSQGAGGSNASPSGASARSSTASSQGVGGSTSSGPGSPATSGTASPGANGVRPANDAAPAGVPSAPTRTGANDGPPASASSTASRTTPPSTTGESAADAAPSGARAQDPADSGAASSADEATPATRSATSTPRAAPDGPPWAATNGAGGTRTEAAGSPRASTGPRDRAGETAAPARAASEPVTASTRVPPVPRRGPQGASEPTRTGAPEDARPVAEAPVRAEEETGRRNHTESRTPPPPAGSDHSASRHDPAPVVHGPAETPAAPVSHEAVTPNYVYTAPDRPALERRQDEQVERYRGRLANEEQRFRLRQEAGRHVEAAVAAHATASFYGVPPDGHRADPVVRAREAGVPEHLIDSVADAYAEALAEPGTGTDGVRQEAQDSLLVTPDGRSEPAGMPHARLVARLEAVLANNEQAPSARDVADALLRRDERFEAFARNAGVPEHLVDTVADAQRTAYGEHADGQEGPRTDPRERLTETLRSQLEQRDHGLNVPEVAERLIREQARADADTSRAWTQDVRERFDARWQEDFDRYLDGTLSRGEFEERFQELVDGLPHELELEAAVRSARASAEQAFDAVGSGRRFSPSEEARIRERFLTETAAQVRRIAEDLGMTGRRVDPDVWNAFHNEATRRTTELNEGLTARLDREHDANARFERFVELSGLDGARDDVRDLRAEYEAEHTAGDGAPRYLDGHWTARIGARVAEDELLGRVEDQIGLHEVGWREASERPREQFDGLDDAAVDRVVEEHKAALRAAGAEFVGDRRAGELTTGDWQRYVEHLTAAHERLVEGLPGRFDEQAGIAAMQRRVDQALEETGPRPSAHVDRVGADFRAAMTEAYRSVVGRPETGVWSGAEITRREAAFYRDHFAPYEASLAHRLDFDAGIDRALEEGAARFHDLTGKGGELTGRARRPYVISDRTFENVAADFRQDWATLYHEVAGPRDRNVQAWLEEERSQGDVFGTTLQDTWERFQTEAGAPRLARQRERAAAENAQWRQRMTAMYREVLGREEVLAEFDRGFSDGHPSLVESRARTDYNAGVESLRARLATGWQTAAGEEARTAVVTEVRQSVAALRQDAVARDEAYRTWQAKPTWTLDLANLEVTRGPFEGQERPSGMWRTRDAADRPRVLTPPGRRAVEALTELRGAVEERDAAYAAFDRLVARANPRIGAQVTSLRESFADRWTSSAPADREALGREFTEQIRDVAGEQEPHDEPGRTGIGWNAQRMVDHAFETALTVDGPAGRIDLARGDPQWDGATRSWYRQELVRLREHHAEERENSGPLTSPQAAEAVRQAAVRLHADAASAARLTRSLEELAARRPAGPDWAPEVHAWYRGEQAALTERALGPLRGRRLPAPDRARLESDFSRQLGGLHDVARGRNLAQEEFGRVLAAQEEGRATLTSRATVQWANERIQELRENYVRDHVAALAADEARRHGWTFDPPPSDAGPADWWRTLAWHAAKVRTVSAYEESFARQEAEAPQSAASHRQAFEEAFDFWTPDTARAVPDVTMAEIRERAWETFEHQAVDEGRQEALGALPGELDREAARQVALRYGRDAYERAFDAWRRAVREPGAERAEWSRTAVDSVRDRQRPEFEAAWESAVGEILAGVPDLRAGLPQVMRAAATRLRELTRGLAEAFGHRADQADFTERFASVVAT